MLMNNATPTVMWKINSGHLLPNLNSYTLLYRSIISKTRKLRQISGKKADCELTGGLGDWAFPATLAAPCFLYLLALKGVDSALLLTDNSHPAKKRKNNAITNPNLHTPFDSDPSWRAHSAHHTPNKFGARYTAGRKRKGSRGVHMELMEGCFYFPLLSSPLPSSWGDKAVLMRCAPVFSQSS